MLSSSPITCQIPHIRFSPFFENVEYLPTAPLPFPYCKSCCLNLQWILNRFGSNVSRIEYFKRINFFNELSILHIPFDEHKKFQTFSFNHNCRIVQRKNFADNFNIDNFTFKSFINI